MRPAHMVYAGRRKRKSGKALEDSNLGECQTACSAIVHLAASVSATALPFCNFA